jgi:hypothetical protein
MMITGFRYCIARWTGWQVGTGTAQGFLKARKEVKASHVLCTEAIPSMAQKGKIAAIRWKV